MDNIKVAKAIAVVRKTGVVNMIDKRGVADVLGQLGYYDEAEYITANKSNYLVLLKLSADY